MKTIILFLILLVAIPMALVAQQTDENTLAIQNYFQISDEKPTNNTPSNLDVDIQSYSNVTQTGNENNTYINTLQAGDQQVINQKGNQNNYEYYNYYSQENSNMTIHQNGNKNSLQVFGENSLMKNATINQKSDFKSMVIKNYTQ